MDYQIVGKNKRRKVQYFIFGEYMLYFFIKMSYSSWKYWFNEKFDIMPTILWHVNDMLMHDILQKLVVWRKTWSTLTCTHPGMKTKTTSNNYLVYIILTCQQYWHFTTKNLPLHTPTLASQDKEKFLIFNIWNFDVIQVHPPNYKINFFILFFKFSFRMWHFNQRILMD
jgi:hypothetical protein